MVEIYIDDEFDLQRIAESGQCFRWEKAEESSYRILAGDTCLYITQLGDGRYGLDCTQEEYSGFWEDYFDLKESYRGIRGRIDRDKDPFLWQAAEHEKGIRILRQDPWEMLISFIISQNKNIPAIQRSISMLAEAAGEKKTDKRGQPFFAFPKPDALEALCREDLKRCSLGYRCQYVHAGAEAVLHHDIDLEELRGADEGKTLDVLTGLYGVGVKVASCVSLFGLHHLNSFPRDVWIRRILEQEYPDGYPFEEYSPYNGIYQQYMFAYYRNSSRKP